MDAEDKPIAEKAKEESVVTETSEVDSPAPPEQNQALQEPNIEQQSSSESLRQNVEITPVEPEKPTEKAENIEEKSPPPAPEPKPRSSSPELTTGATGPQLSTINYQISAADRVAALTFEELRAASQLYAKKMQKEYSQKAVAKRKKNMELNLREIVDYLSTDNGAPLPRIAKHTNITLGTTSKYLRQLIASGKVRASGWGKTRRYFLN